MLCNKSCYRNEKRSKNICCLAPINFLYKDFQCVLCMVYLSQLLFFVNMESKNKHIGESEAHSIWIEHARCHECARCHQVEARHPFGRGQGEGSGVPVIENVKRYNVKMWKCYKNLSMLPK